MDTDKIVSRLQLVAIVNVAVGIALTLIATVFSFLSIYGPIEIYKTYAGTQATLQYLSILQFIVPIIILVGGLWVTFVIYTHNIAFATFLFNSERSDIADSIRELTDKISEKPQNIKFKI